jgi:hypothetical protein
LIIKEKQEVGTETKPIGNQKPSAWQSIVDAVRRVLSGSQARLNRNEVTVLTGKDAKAFIANAENPPAPSEGLIDLVSRR